MWLVGSKPFRSRFQQWTSFSHVFFYTNDIMCHALWCHLSPLPHQFSTFEDVWGWQPCQLGTRAKSHSSPMQWRIYGRGLGPPLFLDQTERPEGRKKHFFETESPIPPSSQGLDDRPTPLIWRCGSATFMIQVILTINSDPGFESVTLTHYVMQVWQNLSYLSGLI